MDIPNQDMRTFRRTIRASTVDEGKLKSEFVCDSRRSA